MSSLIVDGRDVGRPEKNRFCSARRFRWTDTACRDERIAQYDFRLINVVT